MKNSWRVKYGREKKQQAEADGDQVPEGRKMNRNSTSEGSKTIALLGGKSQYIAIGGKLLYIVSHSETTLHRLQW